MAFALPCTSLTGLELQRWRPCLLLSALSSTQHSIRTQQELSAEQGREGPEDIKARRSAPGSLAQRGAAQVLPTADGLFLPCPGMGLGAFLGLGCWEAVGGRWPLGARYTQALAAEGELGLRRECSCPWRGHIGLRRKNWEAQAGCLSPLAGPLPAPCSVDEPQEGGLGLA